MIHRAPVAPSDAAKPAEPAEAAAKSGGTAPRKLIVEDDAEALTHGQMRKSEFVEKVRSMVCATADAILASVGRSTKSCPYIEKWLAFYSEQSSTHVESSLRKYVPEAGRVKQAQDYFPLIKAKVIRGVKTWVETGNIAVPRGVPLTPDGAGTGAKSNAANADGGKSAAAPETTGNAGARVQRKQRGVEAKAIPDVETLQGELGSGRELDSTPRSRMESVFGQSFSHVRIHTDANASRLSSELNARAFTIGGDIAFASGEYQPGTPIGDALIAHELAHVVQQGAANAPAPPMKKGEDNYGFLEADADRSAVGAVVSLWTGAKGKLSDVGRNAMPRLRSGLKLQRCGSGNCPPGNCWQVVGAIAGVATCTCQWRCLSTPSSGDSISDPNYIPPSRPTDTRLHWGALGTTSTIVTSGCLCTPLPEDRGAVCASFSVTNPSLDVRDVGTVAAGIAGGTQHPPSATDPNPRPGIIEPRSAPELPSTGGRTTALPEKEPSAVGGPKGIVEPPATRPPTVPPGIVKPPAPVAPETVPKVPEAPPPGAVKGTSAGGGTPGATVRVVTVTGKEVIVDSNIAISLDRDARGLPLNDAQKMMVAEAKKQGIVVTPKTTQELGQGGHGPVQGVISETKEISIPAAERQAIVDELTQKGVGGPKGINDREVVTQALLAETSSSTTPTLATADNNVIKPLARIGGIDTARLGRYRNVAEYLKYERNSDTFEIEVKGRKLKVRPVQPVRENLK
jgi:Domain of unknown function (DUF4157)